MVKSLAKANTEGNSRSEEIENPEVQKNLRGFSEPTIHQRIPVGKSDPLGKEDLMGINPSQTGKKGRKN